MKLSFPSAPFRFATLTSTTRWGRKGKRKQQQPTTREKVPNWFQDLTDPLDTDAEGLSDLTEHLLGLNPNVADSNGEVRLVSWHFNILAHEFELEHRVIGSASMLDRRWS